MRGLGKEPHGRLEPVPAKPAQHFLRAVRKEYYAEHQPQYGQNPVIRSLGYSL
jgi:hypothetical protein